MRKKVRASAILAAMIWQVPAMADNMSTDERLDQMEQGLRDMEQRLSDQDAAITVKDRQIADLKESQSGGWMSGVEVGALVELEASRTWEDKAEDASDLNLATIELGIGAQVSDWVSANLLLLAEDVDESDGDFSVDEATITLGNIESYPFYFTGGRMVIPFGVFETHMVSDPLTLEMAETKDTAALIGFEKAGFSATAYLFNGSTAKAGDDDSIDNGGATVAYTWENNDASLSVGASYINDISESDGISDAIGTTLVDEVAAYGLYLNSAIGSYSVIAEYVAASDSFDFSELAHNDAGAKPSTWNLEAGYSFNLANYESTIAIGYQGTKEAADLDMPEDRLSLGLSVGLADNTSLNLEWAHDQAYTGGNDSDTVTAQLAVEF